MRGRRLFHEQLNEKSLAFYLQKKGGTTEDYIEYSVRQVLYSLIHFTVLDHDIDMPAEVFSQVIANPDVEHHNSFATFTINGEKKDCYLVCVTTNTFEKEGDTFLLDMHPGIVPMDGTTVYHPDEVPDFWKVVGRNTTYTIDPEEIMANNFAFALMRLDEGYASFANPEIMNGVIEYLKK